MSIRILSQVWESGPDTHSELLVLLALADFCNDDGECWPSVPRIAEKARMSERNVRRVIRKMEASGYVVTDENRGRNASNRYRVIAKPDIQSGLDKTGHHGPENRTPRVIKPDTAMSDKPSRTVIEPSLSGAREEKPTRKRRGSEVALPDGWSPNLEKARAFIADYGTTEGEMAYCFERMKSHAEQTDRRVVNWDAAYRNWCLKAVRDGEIGPNARSRKRGSGQFGCALDDL